MDTDMIEDEKMIIQLQIEEIEKNEQLEKQLTDLLTQEEQLVNDRNLAMRLQAEERGETPQHLNPNAPPFVPKATIVEPSIEAEVVQPGLFAVQRKPHEYHDQ